MGQRIDQRPAELTWNNWTPVERIKWIRSGVFKGDKHSIHEIERYENAPYNRLPKHIIAALINHANRTIKTMGDKTEQNVTYLSSRSADDMVGVMGDCQKEGFKCMVLPKLRTINNGNYRIRVYANYDEIKNIVEKYKDMTHKEEDYGINATEFAKGGTVNTMENTKKAKLVDFESIYSGKVKAYESLSQKDLYFYPVEDIHDYYKVVVESKGRPSGEWDDSLYTYDEALAACKDLAEDKDGFKFAKGGEINKLPADTEEQVKAGKVTYRGTGLGGDYKIKVHGKEYLVTHEKLQELGGPSKIRFEAPNRREFAKGGGISAYYDVEVFQYDWGTGGAYPDFTEAYLNAMKLKKERSLKGNLNTFQYIGVSSDAGDDFAVVYVTEKFIKDIQSEGNFQSKEAYESWKAVAEETLKTGVAHKGKYEKEYATGGGIREGGPTRGKLLPIARAKELASEWSDGVDSALHQFASSGVYMVENHLRYINEIKQQLEREYHRATYSELTRKEEKELNSLMLFFEAEGWKRRIQTIYRKHPTYGYTQIALSEDTPDEIANKVTPLKYLMATGGQLTDYEKHKGQMVKTKQGEFLLFDYKDLSSLSQAIARDILMTEYWPKLRKEGKQGPKTTDYWFEKSGHIFGKKENTKYAAGGEIPERKMNTSYTDQEALKRLSENTNVSEEIRNEAAATLSRIKLEVKDEPATPEELNAAIANTQAIVRETEGNEARQGEKYLYELEKGIVPVEVVESEEAALPKVEPMEEEAAIELVGTWDDQKVANFLMIPLEEVNVKTREEAVNRLVNPNNFAKGGVISKEFTVTLKEPFTLIGTINQSFKKGDTFELANTGGEPGLDGYVTVQHPTERFRNFLIPVSKLEDAKFETGGEIESKTGVMLDGRDFPITRFSSIVVETLTKMGIKYKGATVEKTRKESGSPVIGYDFYTEPPKFDDGSKTLKVNYSYDPTHKWNPKFPNGSVWSMVEDYIGNGIPLRLKAEDTDELKEALKSQFVGLFEKKFLSGGEIAGETVTIEVPKETIVAAIESMKENEKTSMQSTQEKIQRFLERTGQAVGIQSAPHKSLRGYAMSFGAEHEMAEGGPVYTHEITLDEIKRGRFIVTTWKKEGKRTVPDKSIPAFVVRAESKEKAYEAAVKQLNDEHHIKVQPQYDEVEAAGALSEYGEGGKIQEGKKYHIDTYRVSQYPEKRVVDDVTIISTPASMDKMVLVHSPYLQADVLVPKNELKEIDGEIGHKYHLGDKYRRDFDTMGMLKMGSEAELSWGKEKLRKLYDSFQDLNFATECEPLWEAIQHFNDKKIAEEKITEFKSLCKKYLFEGEFGKGGMISHQKLEDLSKLVFGASYDTLTPEQQQTVRDEYRARKEMYGNYSKGGDINGSLIGKRVRVKLPNELKSFTTLVKDEATPTDSKTGKPSEPVIITPRGVFSRKYIIFEKGGTVSSQFEKDTDKWFDGMIKFANEAKGHETINKLIELSKKPATEGNLKNFKKIISGCDCPNPELKKHLLAQLNKVLGKKYKSEFKHAFGGTRMDEKSSAAKEFLSMFHQAATYGEYEVGGGIGRSVTLPNLAYITVDDITEGARFKNPDGVVFIIDKVTPGTEYGTLVESSVEGFPKGNYKNEIKDLTDFLNSEEVYKVVPGTEQIIKNQYTGKMPGRVWDEWTPEQRRHFLKDHAGEITLVGQIDDFIHHKSENLPLEIKEAIGAHVREGEYKRGGEVGIGDTVNYMGHRWTISKGTLDPDKYVTLTRKAYKADLAAHGSVAGAIDATKEGLAKAGYNVNFEEGGEVNDRMDMFSRMFLAYGFKKGRGFAGVLVFNNKDKKLTSSVDLQYRQVEISDGDDQIVYKGFSLRDVDAFLKSQGLASPKPFFEEGGPVSEFAEGGKVSGELGAFLEKIRKAFNESSTTPLRDIEGHEIHGAIGGNNIEIMFASIESKHGKRIDVRRFLINRVPFDYHKKPMSVDRAVEVSKEALNSQSIYEEGGSIGSQTAEAFEKKIKELLKDHKWHFISEEVDGKNVQMKFYVGQKEISVQAFRVNGIEHWNLKFNGKRDFPSAVVNEIKTSKFEEGGDISGGTDGDDDKPIGGDGKPYTPKTQEKLKEEYDYQQSHNPDGSSKTNAEYSQTFESSAPSAVSLDWESNQPDGDLSNATYTATYGSNVFEVKPKVLEDGSQTFVLVINGSEDKTGTKYECLQYAENYVMDEHLKGLSTSTADAVPEENAAYARWDAMTTDEKQEWLIDNLSPGEYNELVTDETVNKEFYELAVTIQERFENAVDFSQESGPVVPENEELWYIVGDSAPMTYDEIVEKNNQLSDDEKISDEHLLRIRHMDVDDIADSYLGNIRRVDIESATGELTDEERAAAEQEFKVSINDYAGLTPTQVWNDAWSLEQRKHFLIDHTNKMDESNDPAFIDDTIQIEYTELPQHIKDEVFRHINQGQYAKGGEVGAKTYYTQGNVGKARYVLNFHDGVKKYDDGSKFYDIRTFQNKEKFKKAIEKLKSEGYTERLFAKGGSIWEKAKAAAGKVKSVAKKGYEGAKKGYSKAKKATKDKIHDTKENIALDVLQDTRDNAKTSADSRTLHDAENIVEDTYSKGGDVKSSSRLKIEGSNIHPDHKKFCGDKGGVIQSIIFDKEKFNILQARKWLKKHDYKYAKVDKTVNTYRFRQLSPVAMEKDSYRTIHLGKDTGITASLACPQKKYLTGGAITSDCGCH